MGEEVPSLFRTPFPRLIKDVNHGTVVVPLNNGRKPQEVVRIGSQTAQVPALCVTLESAARGSSSHLP